MVYPANLVVGRKVIEDAFPGWQEALKGARIRPFESDTVNTVSMCNLAANKRFNRRQNSSSDNQTPAVPRNSTPISNPRSDNIKTHSDSINPINQNQQKGIPNHRPLNLDSQRWKSKEDDHKQLGQNTETQRRGSRPKTEPKPSGKG